jgi:hypothetical protein
MRDLGSSNNDKDDKDEKMIIRQEYKAQSDPFVFRVSIVTLAGTAFVGVITISALSLMSLDVPQGLTAYVSMVTGGLIALFARK